MEKLDFSTHSKEIKASYESVVSGSAEKYAIFTVDKSSALTASDVQQGEITEFLEEFEDGKVQFGLAKISAPGSDVKKIVLLGWCPESSPLKSKVSFGANFGEVAKILKGYHVQVTARDYDDLNATDILKTVSDAAGARYSIQSLANSYGPSKKAPAPVKPSKTTPAPAVKPSVSINKPKPTPVKKSEDAGDEWGGEEESEVRDFHERPLQNAPSAYKPTKVDIEALRKGKSDTTSSTPKPSSVEQTKTSTETEPEIEAKIKSLSLSGSTDGRLSSMPKHKVTNSVASRYSETKTASPSPYGTKPPAPINQYKKNEVRGGGASRNFAMEGGKTPAQIWAEKRGKYQTVEKKDDDTVKSGKDDEYVMVDEPEKESEPEPESEPEAEAEQEPDEEPESLPKPPVRRSVPPPPPPSAPEPEPESEPEPEPESEPEPEAEAEQEPDEEPEAPAAPPSLPSRRSVPPPPEPESEPEQEEAPAPALPSRSTESVPSASGAAKSTRAVAEYAYTKDEDNEIGFDEGDLIVDIEFVDEDWWSGKHSTSGDVGLFPSSYVKIVEGEDKEEEEEENTKAEAGEKKKSATAEYDYDAAEDNELSFKEGDVIQDIEFVDEDWWLGDLNGVRKLFPANYVTLN